MGCIRPPPGVLRPYVRPARRAPAETHARIAAAPRAFPERQTVTMARLEVTQRRTRFASASRTPSPPPPCPARATRPARPAGRRPRQHRRRPRPARTPTRFLARLSHDVFGTLFRNRLSDSGVDLSGSVTAPEPSTLAVAALDEPARPPTRSTPTAPPTGSGPPTNSPTPRTTALSACTPAPCTSTPTRRQPHRGPPRQGTRTRHRVHRPQRPPPARTALRLPGTAPTLVRPRRHPPSPQRG